ncbi:MAG: Hsp20/alpha crystallin family protein [Halobacteriales archaeon]|nr:Hsp20/alpha crystallin family protein [Halobacteriales archaeon]
MRGERPVRVAAQVGRSVGEAVLERVGRTAGRVQEARPLRPDVLEDEDSFLAVFDAPGAAASDVQVRFDDGKVLVRIDRFRDHYEGFEMRYPGRGLSLSGRARLPRDAAVDPEGATATVRSNGTLEVRVPKAESAEADVPVEAAGSEE